MGIIYKIENNYNHKKYIGKSIYNDYNKRWKEHIRDAYDITNKGFNFTIHKAIRKYGKYGKDAFLIEVIETVSDDNILNEREQFWISYYNTYYSGYNDTFGGEGSIKYNRQEICRHWSEDGFSVPKISKIMNCSTYTVKNVLINYNLYNSEENIKRYKKEKVFKKIYQYNKNDGNFIREYESISEAAKNVNVDPSSINKALHGNRPSMAGYYWSFEKIENYPIPLNKHCKKVICLNNNMIFNSVEEAAAWAGNKTSTGIVNACAGRLKTSGKHPDTGERLKWKYYENELADDLAAGRKEGFKGE